MSKSELKSKLPEIETSIFAVMSKMASDYNAINLSQGFPDFNCSEELIHIANMYMEKGYNQYAPMPGVFELRNEISKKVFRDYGKKYDPNEEITITAGATQALFTAFTAIIKPGDEVIIFAPAYDSYRPAIELNGGIVIEVELEPNDFSIPWEVVAKSISSRTKCIVLNSPHNPTGTVLSSTDISNLEKIVNDTDILIISDEVYEHIIFEDKIHLSLSANDNLSKRSFIISSFGKTFHTTGWKIGYCCAPKRLMNEFRKVHQFVVFAVNTPIQHAYSDFIKKSENIYSLNKFYQNKRDLLKGLLTNSKFKLKNCDGTYFQLLDYSNISSKDDYSFSEYLTKEVGVAVIPLSPFYKNGSDKKYVRVCFAKNDNILIQAAKKLLML